ncbi:Hsp20/alpha crystallin family protein [Sinomonas halotolerans]|uniref:Hsp20/alpha crystallin family protein n=1 Tax=Sinomonas halotolerans TaxID=1644133 RepID=A0ABU9X2T4_9MICC
MPEHLRRFGVPEPLRRFVEGDWETGWMRVEEFRDGETLVVRVDAPGIDPENDVEVTVQEGTLSIRTERRESPEDSLKDGYRSEFRYGQFSRTVELPRGARSEDVKASYRDGVLEVRVPIAPEAGPEPTRVTVNRS